VFVLGPPSREDLLADEDPLGDEGFPQDGSSVHGLTFAAAAMAHAENGKANSSPFRSSYCIPIERAMDYRVRGRDDVDVEFFNQHYGHGPDPAEADDKQEVHGNVEWRRIDHEPLFSAESLALKLNCGINNTSLVLAFELPKSKKVLLFVGDAQRGNWISWSDNHWMDDGAKITAKDLLARTVLYKCGHHGSDNATLAGTIHDDYANLSWMGLGKAGGEFTSMINAVSESAITRNTPPWRHPLKSIRDALDKKCQGRVFQTDTEPKKPADVSDAIWDAFTSRATIHELFFEYVIEDT